MPWFPANFVTPVSRGTTHGTPRFRRGCDARTIDFDANFATLAALVAKKAKRESRENGRCE
jgi:hypothetical protein